ncbi:hypothetical protein ACFTQ7_09290 [Lysinibacillus sp. NPDC056959]|uniref:hypothetical protein n=1 Tax=Lysinibacillus sp. NPDC056959 TaxID=3345981 RepID=UPI00362D25F1
MMNDVDFIGSYYKVSSKNGSSQQGGKGNTIDISWSGGWKISGSFALCESGKCFICAKAKRQQQQMFSVAKAKRQLQMF